MVDENSGQEYGSLALIQRGSLTGERKSHWTMTIMGSSSEDLEVV